MAILSVVISAWNEESKIAKCLESVKWADEIILVDNESSDLTVKIAKKYSVKIFSQPNNPMLNVNKNYGFSKAKSDWILCLDADEVITDALKNEILVVLRTVPDVDGYWISRKNIIFGKWIRHGLWWPDKQLRLFRRNKGKFPGVHVHEYIKVEGETGELKEPFLHFNYDSVSQFIRKMDSIYTQNEVAKQLDLKYQFSWIDAIKFPVSDFLKIYFAQEGYKDGLHGLVLALLQAFYSFITFAKLWEKNGFPEVEVSLRSFEDQMRKAGGDYSYWTYTAKIQNTESRPLRFIYKILRRIYGKN